MTSPVVTVAAPPAAPSPVLNPETTANCWSSMTMGYLDKLLLLGASRPLELTDLGGIMPQDESSHLSKLFALHWAEERRRAKPSLIRALRRSLSYHWVFATLAYILAAALGFLPPLMLQQLIAHFQGTAVLNAGVEWFAVVGMLVVPILASLLLAFHNNIMARIGTHFRTMLTSAIYAKALTVRHTGKFTTGEIVTRMSVDAAAGQRTMQFLLMVLVAPAQIAVALWLIYERIGVGTFAGIGFMLGMLPFNMIVFGFLKYLRAKALEQTDKRVRATNEILQGVRQIKYYGWEKPFAEAVGAIRKRELRYLATSAYVVAVAFSLVLLATPVLLPVIVFATYTQGGGSLDAATAFVTIALFNLLRFPMAFLPMGLLQIIQFSVSNKRIADFLMSPDMDPIDKSGDPEKPIVISDADFRWDTDQKPDPEAEARAIAAAASGGGGRGGRGGRGGGRGGSGRGGASRGGDAVGRGRGGTRGGSGAGASTSATGDEIQRPLTLEGVSLTVRKGELLAIVGRVGAGKSSLVAAALGEIPCVRGKLQRSGDIAFCAQQAFLLNDTVRGNIVFGHPSDEVKYQAVLDACALRPDLAAWPSSDSTQIGEQGVTCSGGQKARIALARALYSPLPTVVLDDVLSAVDSHVGAHLFEQAIKGPLMHGRTCVFVTNALQYLPQCDRIAVVAERRIVALDAYPALQASGLLDSLRADKTTRSAAAPDAQTEASSTGSASPMLADTPIPAAVAGVDGAATPAVPEAAIVPVPAAKAAASSGDAAVDPKALVVTAATLARPARPSAPAAELMTKEERATGAVDASVYAYYLASGGLILWVLTITWQTLARACEVAASFWIGKWSDDMLASQRAGTVSTFDSPWYLNIYTALSLGAVIFITFRAVNQATVRNFASRRMHARLLARVLRAPTQQFDRTPVGRILSRFSRDMDVVDSELSATVGQFLGTLWSVLGSLVAIAVSTKGIFLAPLVPIMAVYFRIQAFFRRSSTELQRLESISRSPIFSGFSQVLIGTSSVRAYGRGEAFKAVNHKALNTNNTAFILISFAASWLAIRLDVLGSFISFFIAMLAAATNPLNLLPAGWVAVGLAFSLEMSQFLKHMVRMAATLESQMNSVERLRYYTEQFPQEAPDVIPDNRPPAEWPTKGAISVRNLRLRYGTLAAMPEARSKHADKDAVNAIASDAAPATARLQAVVVAGGADPSNVGIELRGNPLVGRLEDASVGSDRDVLKGISFDVPGGCKCAIVGRTGSGKTSFMAALFRIVEPCGGSITIDGIDVSTIGLDDLRCKLAIIPQDPVLFAGTLRYNLDPFNKHSDDDVKQALQRAQLGGYAMDWDVSEGGGNLSVGERQLVCIARALLRNARIVALDEASAAIDHKTDAIIQRVVRECFADSTVLCIAHRLHTIADSDVLLVLDHGNVVEFDAPAALLEREGSVFRGMVEALGPESAADIRAAAQAHSESGIQLRAERA